MVYKISIIIPVYNTEKYLSKAIESVLNQTFSDFEIIIINDGSEDNSGKIADCYSMNHEKIKVIHKDNEGLGYARNTGLKYANGDYILFLDSDDYIDKYTLEKVYNKAKNTNSDITVFNMRKVRECDGSVIEEQFLNLNDEIVDMKSIGINEYFKNYFFPYIHGHEACNKLYKSELIKKSQVLFDKNDYICSEDLLFNLKLIPYIQTIASINESFYNYVQRENSLMNTPYRNNLNYRFTNLINTFYEYINQFKDIDLENEISILSYNLLNAILYNESEKYGNKIRVYLRELKYTNKNSKIFKQSLKNITYSNYCKELLIANNIKRKTIVIIRVFCFLCYINVYLGGSFWYIFMKLLARQ